MEYGLASFLFDEIRRNNPHAKAPNLQAWARVFDLMIRKDNRTQEEIQAVIAWCQKDHFWHKNILSPGKLREQFDRLTLGMKGNGSGQRTQSGRTPSWL